jgi:hypothetical protein
LLSSPHLAENLETVQVNKDVTSKSRADCVDAFCEGFSMNRSHLLNWLPSRTVRRTRRARPRLHPWRFVRPRLEWLEDRTLLTTWIVDQTPGVGQFTTIQGAVSSNMVVNGDTIIVDPGTYTEQVTINKSLTLTNKAGAAAPTIKTPPTLVPDAFGTHAIVEMNNMAHVTMSGFTVTGPANRDPGIDFGIFVAGNANLDLSATNVTDIHGTPFNGDQTGNGIEVGLVSLPTGGAGMGLPTASTATIDNVTVSECQKTGIEVDGAGSMATITNCMVTLRSQGLVLGSVGTLRSGRPAEAAGAVAALPHHGRAVSAHRCRLPRRGAPRYRRTLVPSGIPRGFRGHH